MLGLCLLGDILVIAAADFYLAILLGCNVGLSVRSSLFVHFSVYTT